ncbi:hypothetical protein [Nocardia sp. NPDC056000]|uniref:hypothetical protein n=1 Tax=Nocardia sp. NPDC056000 TaxID=3345674 RepID=UPI0035D59C41
MLLQGFEQSEKIGAFGSQAFGNSLGVAQCLLFIGHIRFRERLADVVISPGLTVLHEHGSQLCQCGVRIGGDGPEFGRQRAQWILVYPKRIAHGTPRCRISLSSRGPTDGSVQ